MPTIPVPHAAVDFSRDHHCLILQGCVEEVMRLIRQGRFTFTPETKGVKSDGGIDWVTNIDNAAQRIYEQFLKTTFEHDGVIGEENGLRLETGNGYWFAVDPLDGTSAFVRKQSHGVSTMIARIKDGRVTMAMIGDVTSMELYAFGELTPPYRLDILDMRDFKDAAQALRIDEQKLLRDQFVLLRDPVSKYSGLTQRLITPNHSTRLFDSHEITGGSIGVSTARLWKGEVGACIFSSGKRTPWDETPIMGFNQRMGFVTFDILPETETFCDSLSRRADERASRLVYAEPREQLVIHESRLNELTDWCNKHDVNIDMR